VIGGDINSQRAHMSTELLRRGFTPAIPEGAKTHRDGNHLDQCWVLNVQLVKAAIAKLIGEMSDHKLIKLVVGADVRHRKDQPVWEAYDQVKGRVPIAKFPQSNIKRMMSDQSVQDHLVDSRVNLMERPIIQQIPEDLANQFAPRDIPTRPVVRYQKSKQLPKYSEELQIKMKLDNQQMLDDLKWYYDAKDMK
jgi:hypothetical protein